MPRNVTRKAPSLLAVTTFLYVAFAETLTVTRSLGRKPVPRTTTGEREVNRDVRRTSSRSRRLPPEAAGT